MPSQRDDPQRVKRHIEASVVVLLSISELSYYLCTKIFSLGNSELSSSYTRAQAKGISDELIRRGFKGAKCYVGMRYWTPYTQKVHSVSCWMSTLQWADPS